MKKLRINAPHDVIFLRSLTFVFISTDGFGGFGSISLLQTPSFSRLAKIDLRLYSGPSSAQPVIGDGMLLEVDESTRIILGSGSPRRKELLSELFSQYSVLTSDQEPRPREGEAPLDYCLRSAKAKAVDILEKNDLPEKSLVFAFDTVVSIDGEILGKPRNSTENLEMLMKLNGRVHEVQSAWYICDSGGNTVHRGVETTEVVFQDLNSSVYRAYIATGDGLDKAGGYGIQSGGKILVESIRGCYFNVVGLPLPRLFLNLLDLGFQLKNT